MRCAPRRMLLVKRECARTHFVHTHFDRRAVAARQPHAYLRCTRSSKLRQILSSILSQLQGGGGGGKRKRAQGYAAPGGSEATLIADLQAACGAPCDAAAAPPPAAAGPSGNAPGRAQQRQQQRQQQQQQRLVVLDDVHLLLMADDAAARPGDGAPVLRGLLQVGGPRARRRGAAGCRRPRTRRAC